LFFRGSSPFAKQQIRHEEYLSKELEKQAPSFDAPFVANLPSMQKRHAEATQEEMTKYYQVQGEKMVELSWY